MSGSLKDPNSDVEINSDGDSIIGGDVAGRDIVKTVVNVIQSPQGIALVALVAVVAIFGIVALAISNPPRTGVPTQPASATTALAGTLYITSPSTETADVAASAPPITTAEISCLGDYLNDVSSVKQIRLEVGTSQQDLAVPSGERLGNSPIGPLGVWLTRSGQPIAALKFLILHEGDTVMAFSITSVVSGDCEAVIDYGNDTRPNSATTLQNWDTLRISLADRTYTLRFGWQGDHISFSFRELE